MTMENPPDRPALPRPARERWQPLRSGLLNLYRFDYEEFHFEQGRLLLRGNNGSGKSRVLAFQLPFLLDGEIRPGRLEPDGDPAKRVEWNLLLGRHSDRTGYTWLEFGRRSEDGSEAYVTIGCGMRAVAGESGLHSRWYFVTPQRIGRDLFLQTAQRTPLSRIQLEAAVGTAGKVYQRPDEYRRAVDEALFQLGPRMVPLVDLLLQLRRTQLSKKLEEDDLSRALSDALSTLPGSILDDVAESFSSLQADQLAVRDFHTAQDAVDAFLANYGVYVRIAVRRRAQAVRETHSRYEGAQRELRDAERRQNAAKARLEELRSAVAEAATQLAGAEAEERALRASPEMRTAGELARAAEAAAKSARTLEQAEADLARGEEAVTATAAQEAEQQEAVDRLAKETQGVLRQAGKTAQEATVGDVHRKHMPTDLAGGESPPVSRTRPILEGEVGRVRRAAERLAELDQQVSGETARLRQAEQAAQQAATDLSQAREKERQAREAAEQAEAALAEAYDRWRERLRQLQPAPRAVWHEELGQWLERREGPSPVTVAIAAAETNARDGLLQRELSLRLQRERIDQRAAEVATAIAETERGLAASPPPPRLARTVREGRPGAPFWQVVDFRPDLGDELRAGLEAALEASGLLDAWLMPDGSLLNEADDRFLLLSPEKTLPGRERDLSRLLVPALDPDEAGAAALTDAAVERMLREVGSVAETGDHWVCTDGRWRLGPLAGKAAKPAAEFLGAGARADARRRRLAALRLEAEEIERQRAAVRELGRSLETERAALDEELAAAPGDGTLRECAVRREAAAVTVNERSAASREAEATAERVRGRLREAAEVRERDASDFGLKDWIGRSAELREALREYEIALAALWPGLRHYESARAQLSQARERAGAAQAEAARRRSQRDQERQTEAADRQTYETLKAMHGASVADVLRRLEAAEKAIHDTKSRQTKLQQEQNETQIGEAAAGKDADIARERRGDSEEKRREAMRGLRDLADQRLLAEAHPALREVPAEEWSPAQAIDVVRHQIDVHLADVPDDAEAWKRSQNTIQAHFQELRDRLITGGYNPELHPVDDLLAARCAFRGQIHTMSELRTAFAGEIAQREELLRARERETIENHLLAEAAVELVKLIRAADRWRHDANEELGQRPTSSGVKFRFQWEPDEDTGFASVRPILLRSAELWTPAERSALAQFLQRRIAAEQAAVDGASWRDHLAGALDYRRWHRFVVERHQDGQWKRLNRASYGTGSGGEKALALTLPRFAAAAAHYRSAGRTAPRLIMLDEAFAGIDQSMRSQCMGILAQFDLDVMMTSELEWGCYQTVPGLAIYHLTTLPGMDAVGATRFVWNGRERRQEDTPLPPAAPPAPASSEAFAEGLFAPGSS